MNSASYFFFFFHFGRSLSEYARREWFLMDVIVSMNCHNEAHIFLMWSHCCVDIDIAIKFKCVRYRRVEFLLEVFYNGIYLSYLAVHLKNILTHYMFAWLYHITSNHCLISFDEGMKGRGRRGRRARENSTLWLLPTNSNVEPMLVENNTLTSSIIIYVCRWNLRDA